MPAEDEQLEQVGGDSDRYDSELRPELMRRAIAEIQDAGVEVDIWKIEGVDRSEDCESIVAQTRVGGRDGVVCVVLGRGADDDKVDHWLSQAAPVDGFVGFAIGRSIWGDALKGYLDGSLERSEAGGADRAQLPALRRGVREQRGGRAVVGRSRTATPRTRWITFSPVRVNQSLSDIEEAFREEAVEEERQRKDALRREAAQQSRMRRSNRVEKQGNMRFFSLVAALFLTAVIVTWVMFEALALLTAP